MVLAPDWRMRGWSLHPESRRKADGRIKGDNMGDFSLVDEIFKIFSHHMQPKFIVTAVGFISEFLPFPFVDVPGAIDEVPRNLLP
jgi:hypothetical protein